MYNKAQSVFNDDDLEEVHGILKMVSDFMIQGEVTRKPVDSKRFLAQIVNFIAKSITHSKEEMIVGKNKN